MQEKDLAWLAGIWEGEGSILLYSRTHKDNRTQIIPSLEVSNTDVHIMNNVRRITTEMGCNFSWREYMPKKGRRKVYKLETSHAYQIKIFLEYINPYMIGEKRAYGETLLAFVTRRLEKADGKSLKHTPYDEEDYEFVRSSTTTRERATAQDIVYSSVKAEV